MKTKTLWLILPLVFVGMEVATATDCTVTGGNATAASGSAADVQACIDNPAIVAGSTVTIPPGIWEWTSRVNINKPITLKGAGAAAPSSPTVFGAPDDLTTTVKDSVQSGRFLNVTLIPNSLNVVRITRIDFQHGARTGGIVPPPVGVAGVGGTGGENIEKPEQNCTRFRIDNCNWNDPKGSIVFNDAIGVVDHVTLNRGSINPTLGSPLTYVGFPLWAQSAASGQGLGDGSWNQPVVLGSDKFVFYENCIVTTTAETSLTDTGGNQSPAGRMVVRNSILNKTKLEFHGTEGRARGSRIMIAYDNTWNQTKTLCSVRGGMLIAHGNTVNTAGVSGTPTFDLTNFRLGEFGGPADGTFPMDRNDQSEHGWGAGIWFKGKADGASSSAPASGGVPLWQVKVKKADGTPVTDWSTNQWKYFTIRRLSGRTGSINFAHMISNTASPDNTVTYQRRKNQSTTVLSLDFIDGEDLEFRKVEHPSDGSGTGTSGLVAGTGWPPPTIPFPSGRNDQEWAGKALGGAVVTPPSHTPCYQWDNGSAVFAFKEGGRADGTPGFEADAKNEPMPNYTPGDPNWELPHPHWLIAKTESGTDPAPGTTPVPGATPTPTPVAPSNLVAAAVSSTQINLSWTDNSNDETGFTIQRSLTSDFTSVTPITKSANATSHSDTGLTASTLYYYRIRADKSALVSNWSIPANGTTGGGGSAPVAPVATEDTLQTNNTFQANWNAPTSGSAPTGYRLDVSTSDIFAPGTFVSDFSDHDTLNVLTFNVTGLSPVTTYYYRVSAYNTEGTSPESNVITAITTTAPVVSGPARGSRTQQRGSR